MDTDKRIEMFLGMFETAMLTQEAIDNLIDIGFFTAPASTKYHGNYEGGLFDHSFKVTQHLKELTKQNGLTWKRDESPFIVGMFHDLCKYDQYKHPVTAVIRDLTDSRRNIIDPSAWEYNGNTYLKGHGDKSVMLLSTFMRLTEEEVMCIRYHMGAFTDQEEWSFYTRAIHLYPNVLWTHHADMLASHVDGI